MERPKPVTSRSVEMTKVDASRQLPVAVFNGPLKASSGVTLKSEYGLPSTHG